MKCRKIEKQLIEACYNELTDENQQRFFTHLDQCPKCRQAFKEMQNTLNIVSAQQIPERGDAYWDAYQEKLSEKLRKPARVQKTSFTKWHVRPAPSMKWALSVACALIIGIFIGRINLKQSALPQSQTAGYKENTHLASLQNAASYLEGSKLILLGIINSEGDNASFDLQQEKSAALVSQAGPLKKNLANNNQYLLSELVSELELILMQIANLENENDLAGIDLIQTGSEQRALLFKINIGEMHLSGQKEAFDKKANVPAI